MSSSLKSRDPEPAKTDAQRSALIEVRDLSVSFVDKHGERFSVLRNIDLSLQPKAIMGVVGESGSGKSTLANAMMGLLPKNAVKEKGDIILKGKVVDPIALRGRALAMVFQDPMNALHPVMTIGTQMVDAQRARFPNHLIRELRKRAAEMLTKVGIADPEKRLSCYPHELSGGMRQRVMIAMALLVEPDLLVADEPTTALDATIEAQIAELFRASRDTLDGATLFVSHSLGLVSELCDEVVVLYAGAIVERADVAELFNAPRHPYTRALIACEPRSDDQSDEAMVSIPGGLPDLSSLPAGCVFASRCLHASQICRQIAPPLVTAGQNHLAACWHPQ
ncbi:peptide ABC transporter ATP-binding protein [Mesorhizobium hawassense]|uniref:Peptide ABC transporter ATP-binding protein n=1 Tax=Mesorhizobium hawassense TaxID=1209954 RepID=A0A330HVQ8_9HYPH|nr:ABC transporter ATP-binding protein [Mesorhizobium hawassense]RAZ91760.1 peptide ABC transporter ATP-binding protein [Mesorhizobium hawassense]